LTVNPGFGGQSFIPQVTSKIARIRQMIADRPIHLEVDGGITAATAPAAVKSGADVLVAGSAIFSGATRSDYGRNINALRQAAAQALFA
jgi:ribulose-phosphate 3-epimerase